MMFAHAIALLTTVSITALTVVPAETRSDYDPDAVSPGPVGFAVVALLAIALFFLGYDMLRRLRRSKYRAEIRAELAEELEANEAGEPSKDAQS